MKKTNDNFVKVFKSKKLKSSKPYKYELVVFVSVNIDNLKALSKLKLSKVRILDSTKIDKINDIKTKKEILIS